MNKKIQDNPEKNAQASVKDLISINMPSNITDLLEQQSCAYFGTHEKSYVDDLAYAETNNYNVVAAKWEKHLWSEEGGGIEWTEWTSTYVNKKGTDKSNRFKKICNQT